MKTKYILSYLKVMGRTITYLMRTFTRTSKVLVSTLYTFPGFSTDMYSSLNQYFIISLTIHFLDQNLNLWKFVLYEEYFGKGRWHTGRNILFALETMFREARLDGDNIHRFILMDNASNNKRCVTLFEGDGVPYGVPFTPFS